MIKLSIIIPMYNAEEFILKALDSIPRRDDIEVIVVDDCSTDNSYNIVKNYEGLNIKLFKNEKNSGTGFSTNVGYDHAQGDYIVGLDNDDWLLTDNYNILVDKLYNWDYDIIYYGNEINDGKLWLGKFRTAIWSYFIKREFLGVKRMPTFRWAADWYFTKDLLEQQNPRLHICNIVGYHYNFPREGSIMWNRKHGLSIGGDNE